MSVELNTRLSGELERVLAFGRGDRGLLGLLRQDHVRINSLLQGVGRHLDEPDTRRRLLQRVSDELTAHCLAEAEVLYVSRKRAASPANPVRQSEREHEEILRSLRELRQTPAVDPGWPARFEALQRLVALHFQDEEDQLFRAVREELDHRERKRLGKEYARARDAHRAEQPV